MAAQRTKLTPWKIGGIAVLVLSILFGVEGGEYGTSDLIHQRMRRRELLGRIDSLRREIDSLERLKHAIASDPAMQERIAREEFGMVKEKEILYRFAEPDSVVSQESTGARHQ